MSKISSQECHVLFVVHCFIEFFVVFDSWLEDSLNEYIGAISSGDFNEIFNSCLFLKRFFPSFQFLSELFFDLFPQLFVQEAFSNKFQHIYIFGLFV